MGIETVLAAIGGFALIFGALFLCWYYHICWFETSETVMVSGRQSEIVISDIDYGTSDVIVHEEHHYVSDPGVDVEVHHDIEIETGGGVEVEYEVGGDD